MDLRIGCCGFPVDKDTYFKKAKVVELQETFTASAGAEECRKLRALAPEGFEFCVKAGQDITHETFMSRGSTKEKKTQNAPEKEAGYFKPTDRVRASWEATKQAAEILKAGVIVFESPDLFLPNRRNISNMYRFFKEAGRSGELYVWIPPEQLA